MRRFIDGEHFRYRRFAKGGPTSEEVELKPGAGLVIEAPRTRLMERAAADFRRFCEECMEAPLAPTQWGGG